MPSASSCLLHVLCFAEYPYQTESNGIKTDGAYFWNIWKIPEEKSTRDGACRGIVTADVLVKGLSHGAIATRKLKGVNQDKGHERFLYWFGPLR